MESKSEISRILDHDFVPHTVTPENFHTVKAAIPRQPGLYKISTNCPIEVLKTTEPAENKMHYNIEKRVLDSTIYLTTLLANKLKINYIVFTTDITKPQTTV
jgi:hypothetical protein